MLPRARFPATAPSHLRILLAASTLIAIAAPAGAQPAASQEGKTADSEQKSEAEAPKTKARRDPSTVEDVAMSPLRDTNIDPRDIPPELQAIIDYPYARLPKMNCAAISSAVQELDAVLGPDLDARGEPDTLWKKRERAAGRIAKSFVGGLIPFRSFVREITGASDSERRFRAAMEAGITRRAYLKGYSDARRCKPPASPLPYTPQTAGANVEQAGKNNNGKDAKSDKPAAE